MIKVEYSANNSGGFWWLKRADWVALRDAGWEVESRWKDQEGTSATKEFATIKEAIKEWEQLTGQDASATGCTCCGPPHSFSWDEDEDWGFCSGSGVLKYLYDERPSYREALERLNKK
jgi:hypothetical protein